MVIERLGNETYNFQMNNLNLLIRDHHFKMGMTTVFGVGSYFLSIS